MDLKHFHILFVSLVFILSGFGAYASLVSYDETGNFGFLVSAVVSMVFFLAALPYGIWFWGKLKKSALL